MNKKGQSLVIFIIILPIIFASLAFIYDYALVVYNQNKYESVSKSIIKLNLQEEDIKDLYVKNNYKIDNFKYENIDNKINISNYYYIDSVFGNILNIKKYKCEINYVVYVENNDIIIIDNKG